jgi:hypothetical protein
MFNFVDKKELTVLRNSVENLIKEKQSLKTEIEELKLKKRLEGEEIRHMTRINEERMKAELENEKVALEKKKAEEISKFKEEQRQELVESLRKFHDKMESRFSSELANLKEVYTLLMQRLPNVNVELTKRIKG